MISTIKKNIYIKIGVFLAIILMAFIIIIFSKSIENKNIDVGTKDFSYNINSFKDISLKAKAVFVWDINKQKSIYSLNENAQLPLASLAKLVTAITAVDILPDSSVITIDNSSLKKDGDSGLFVNEKWDFKNLIKFTLMVSSNDGASAIASVAGFTISDFPVKGAENEITFVEAMNKKVKEIGLNQTYFINPTGLDKNKAVSGAYGSARDIAKLLEYIIKHNPELVEATRHKKLNFSSINEIEHMALNTNFSISSLPGLIASKTGFTDLAGGNLVIAFDAGINRPIVIAVLGSTQEDRFTDIEKLVEASLNSL